LYFRRYEQPGFEPALLVWLKEDRSGRFFILDSQLEVMEFALDELVTHLAVNLDQLDIVAHVSHLLIQYGGSTAKKVSL
jgi:hypothetical protein